VSTSLETSQAAVRIQDARQTVLASQQSRQSAASTVELMLRVVHLFELTLCPRVYYVLGGGDASV